MVKALITIAFFVFGSFCKEPLFLKDFILWDVGQGQWLTFVGVHTCTHFDIGGEFLPKKSLLSCRHKLNILYLSHWDWDHLSFVFETRRAGLEFCIAHLPEGTSKVKKTLEGWPLCLKTSELQVEVFPSHLNSRNNNDMSSIFQVGFPDQKHKMLIMGDAPKKREKNLIKKYPLNDVIYLIAGHHGSNTSSGLDFLNQLPDLKLALISARKTKYGHPHPKVKARFEQRRVPLLSTNDWGTFRIPF